MRLVIALVVVLSFPAISAAQTTWYVPDDFPTINEAINSAADREIIIVRPGTYFERLVISKNVTIKSQMGPSHTTIDGSQMGFVVRSTILGNKAELEGFTITNGCGLFGKVGGGIYIKNADVHIRNNIIEHNSAEWDGGGIFVDGYTAPRIYDNIIRNNSANGGGGIYVANNARPILENNRFEANNATTAGGGLCIYGGSPIVTGNVFVQNIAGNGGAIYQHFDKDAFIKGNCFEMNSAAVYGGAYHASESEGIVYNNLFTGNKAGDGGAALISGLSDLAMMNNTFYGNTAVNHGGGLSCWTSSTVTLANSIFWQNTDDSAYEISVNGSELNISCSVVESGLSACEVDGTSILNWNLGMIESDPAFVGPGAADLRLTRFSPCINMGQEVSGLNDDLDGNLRPHMGLFDMGAYEFTGTHTLSARSFALSQSAGGVIPFYLHAGALHAGKWYCMFSGLGGTSPGVTLPGGQATLPINPDVFTDFVLARLHSPYFHNFLSVLNTGGMGSAVLDIPAGAIPLGGVGYKMYFAYAIDTFDMASNPLVVEILP